MRMNMGVLETRSRRALSAGGAAARPVRRRGATKILWIALSMALGAPSALAQVYRAAPQAPLSRHPAPARACPEVLRFGEAPGAAEVAAPAPLNRHASPLAFDPARPPRVVSGGEVGSPLAVQSAVTNASREARRGWIEVAACRVGSQECVYTSGVLRDARGVERVPPRGRAEAQAASPGALPPGHWTVRALLFDDTERLVDVAELGSLSLGAARLRLADVRYPAGSVWDDVRGAGPATLSASVRNDGDAPGTAQVVFVLEGHAAAGCATELYSAPLPTAPGADAQAIATWAPRRAGVYRLRVMLLDAEGQLVEDRRGLPVAAGPAPAP